MSGPCKLIEPFLQQSAELFENDLDVVKFDVDAEDTDDVQVELLLQGALPQALPHLVLFHKGKVMAVHSGVLKQDQLNDFVKKTLMKIQTSNTATIKLAPEPRRVKARKLAETGVAFKEEGVDKMAKKGYISFGSRSQPDEYALSLSF